MIPFIYFPFKPYRITQRWGNPNPSYSSQFNDPQFLLHNGVDANVGGNPKTGWPVYCPVAGFRVSEVAYYPNGWQFCSAGAWDGVSTFGGSAVAISVVDGHSSADTNGAVSGSITMTANASVNGGSIATVAFGPVAAVTPATAGFLYLMV